MASHYYDKKMHKAGVRSLMSQLKAKQLRTQNGGTVYTVSGGGEAFVEPQGDMYRVRLYRGSCPC